MENTSHICCGFPYQEYKNHFDHPVTLLCTFSVLWARCPELDTAKPPLCWAKMEQPLTSLKNNSLVYPSEFVICLFHSMAFLTHTEFLPHCCPQNICEGLVLARSSPCEKIILTLFLSVVSSLGLGFFVLWGFELAIWLGFGELGGTVGWRVSWVVGGATGFYLRVYKFSSSRGISTCGTQKTEMSLYSTVVK